MYLPKPGGKAPRVGIIPSYLCKIAVCMRALYIYLYIYLLRKQT